MTAWRQPWTEAAQLNFDRQHPFARWLDSVYQSRNGEVIEAIRRGILENCDTRTKSIAMMSAATNSNFELMEHLLDHCDDRTKSRALGSVISGLDFESIQFLRDRGVTIEPESNRGFSSVTQCLLRSRTWLPLWKWTEVDPRSLELIFEMGGKLGLIEAVLLNDLDLARARLDAGDNPNIDAGNTHGPPLMLAAKRGFHEMVDLLLDRGADLDGVDDLYETSLTYAALIGHEAIARRLLDRGADIHHAVSGLEYAATHAHLDVVKLLLDRGANLDAGYPHESALVHAAQHGHRQVAEFLISKKARRSLLEALALGDMPLFESLMARRQERRYAVDDVSNLHFGRLAMYAVAIGNLAAVRLCLDHGAAPLGSPVVGNDHTLIAEAASRGHREIVDLLIERGADLHAMGSDKTTPLEFATRNGHHEIVGILQSAGAER